MGGLAGQIRFDGRDVDRSRLVHACARQAQRAPAGWQVLDASSMRIAAARPSPPLSSMACCADPETGLVVAFEGAIYNLAELASEVALAAGLSMQEALNPLRVLAAGYRRWGDALATRLDGDFAFVVWDPIGKCGYAASDPAGVQPLFYAHEPGVHFSFASEALALGGLLGVDVRTPESRLVEQLVPALEVLEHVEPLVRGVRRLPAAHWCVFRAGSVQMCRYWSPGASSPPLRADDTPGWVEGFGWHLERAVAKRSSGESGTSAVMFSGGLDSSSVLALLRLVDGEGPLPTLSLVDSGDAGCPETGAIDQMNGYCRATPIQIDVANCADAAADARKIIAAAPRYLSGRGAFLHVCYARAAARGIHVVADGLDADALLSHGGVGELLLRQGRLREFHRNGRDFAKLRAGETCDEFGLVRGAAKLLAPRGLRRLVAALRNRVSMAQWLDDSLLNKETVARFQLEARIAYMASLLGPPRQSTDQRFHSSMDSVVPRDGIARTNARAAQHGLQLRHPFMDKALMDFCAWMPLDLRLRDGWNKWVMRQAMDAHLPAEIAWRRDKTHIGARFDRLVLQPVLDRLVVDLSRGSAATQRYVDRDRVLDLGRRWHAGEISAVWKLTPLLLLEHWLQCDQERVEWGR